MGGGVGGRQSPTVYNAAFNQFQFWDGRARSLEEQAIGPIHNPVEMAETHEHVVAKLGGSRVINNSSEPSLEPRSICRTLPRRWAAYERTVLSTNSAFDKYVSGDAKAMDDAAVRGLALFKGKARCILCHNGVNFTDNQFHNLGVPQVGPMREGPWSLCCDQGGEGQGRVQDADLPQHYGDVSLHA